MVYGLCAPPSPKKDRVGKFHISTVQLCDGRWETCVFHGEELLEEHTEMTWDDPDKQHAMVVDRMRGR